MNWEDIRHAADNGLEPVNGGYTQARRGIATLPDGRRIFVKIATDDKTLAWILLEQAAYQWLSEQGYTHMPSLLAIGPDGLALADHSDWDWQDSWNEAKVNAALDCLAALTPLSDAARGRYRHGDFRLSGSNPWQLVPDSIMAYRDFVDEDTCQQLEQLLGDRKLRAAYTALADGEPWKGDDLVHYDARSDNFGFDAASSQGVLVDWNWLCLGNAAFDRTALLVNVQLLGFDVMPRYNDRLDKASLAWLMGFWLYHATGSKDTVYLKRLRPRQVANALVAHRLLEQL